MMNLNRTTAALIEDLRPLRFEPPVTHVYNPLEYAGKSYGRYLKLYGDRPKEVILVGMNPGPWGMAQTGVPFGEVKSVRGWMGIEARVGSPPVIHPKRPVLGFACARSEVSGKRLWGWAAKAFDTPERFFARFFVANYCPLIFYEESGKNRTPDSLGVSEKTPLLAACDLALRRTVEWLEPDHVVGIGNFAEARAREALAGIDVRIGRIAHPSPANPRANRGWEPLIAKEFAALGIRI
jgi:single-strand selective monofunctional uracil DNA glycosylase